MLKIKNTNIFKLCLSLTLMFTAICAVSSNLHAEVSAVDSNADSDRNHYLKDGRYTTGRAYCFFNLVNSDKNTLLLDVIVDRSCTDGGLYEFKRVGIDSYLHHESSVSIIDKNQYDRCSIKEEVKDKSLLPCQNLDFLYELNGSKYYFIAREGDTIQIAKVKLQIIKESAMYVLRNYKSLVRKDKILTESYQYKILYSQN